MERPQSGLALTVRPASGARRLAAGTVDASAALLLALLLSGSAGRWFAARAVTALRIGQPDSLWTGGIPMALGAVGDLVYGLPLALSLILLAEPLTGLTPGKSLLRIRIDAPPAGRSLLVRSLIKGAGAFALTLALALGSWPATLAAAGIAAIALLGAVPALFGRATLHDRASSTRAVRGI